MKLWKYIFGLLFLALSLIVIALLQVPDGNLHIIACNVGQGDAILITYGKTQILTDGGPDKSVLNCLGKHVPFWDRNIELVISTHPDADHSTGLIDVIKNYKVDQILINPLDPGTPVYEVLKKEVGGRGIPVINPVEGMKLGVGLIYLDIFNPSEELNGRLIVKNADDKMGKYQISGVTNLYSIVYKLSFKNFSGLFPGDIPPEASNRLAVGQPIGPINYIKIPHHGSVNGLTENLLKVLMPKVAVISVGKNTWGFPRPEILDMLGKKGVRILRTDEMGNIEIVTDGVKYWTKKNGSLFSFWGR
jgi:competence protein ComEC